MPGIRTEHIGAIYADRRSARGPAASTDAGCVDSLETAFAKGAAAAATRFAGNGVRQGTRAVLRVR